MPVTHRCTSDDIENMIEPVLKMIASNKKGVRQTELEKLLVMSRDDFMKLIKKMVKIKGFSRHQVEKYTNNENYILQYIPVNIQNDIQSDKLEDIEKISIMMVDCYILHQKTRYNTNKRIHQFIEIFGKKSLFCRLGLGRCSKNHIFGNDIPIFIIS